MTAHTGGKWTDCTPGLGSPTPSQRAEERGGEGQRRGCERAQWGARHTWDSGAATKSPACPPGAVSDSLSFLPSAKPWTQTGLSVLVFVQALGPEEPKLNTCTCPARGAEAPSLLGVRGRGGRPHDQLGHCENQRGERSLMPESGPSGGGGCSHMGQLEAN